MIRLWSPRRSLQAKLGAGFVTIAAGWLMLVPSAHAAGSGLSVSQEDIFILPEQGSTIQVVDNLQVRNKSTAQQSLKVTLPSGATKATFSKDGHTVPAAGAKSVQIPGIAAKSSADIVETYSLQLSQQDDVQFTLHNHYSVYTARLYLPIGNASISAQGLLTDTSTVTIHGTKFRVFTRPGIPSGQDWTLSIQMLPSATSNPQLSVPVIGTRPDNFVNTLQAIGNLILAAFILVLGLFSIRATQWGRSSQRQLSKEEALLRSWENIELQYQDGALTESEYRTRRQQLKDRLIQFQSGASS